MDVKRWVASLSEGPPPMLLVAQTNPGIDSNAVLLCGNTSPEFVFSSEYDKLWQALERIAYMVACNDEVRGPMFNMAKEIAMRAIGFEIVEQPRTGA